MIVVCVKEWEYFQKCKWYVECEKDYSNDGDSGYYILYQLVVIFGEFL